MKWARETPVGIWLLCGAFAMLTPLTHVMVQYCAPRDVVPTGLHKPDSAIFIHSMNMFQTGFHSPYATCKSAIGAYSPEFFPAPFHWMYGIVGVVGKFVGIGPFMALGIANGAGAFCFLLAVYHFFRATVPTRSGMAFIFYTCSGGLGGPLYMLCAMFGITDSSTFPAQFYRFAIYDLVEGSNLASYLLFTRLYYTLPLALGFAGLTTFIGARSFKCPYHLLFAWLLLFAATFVNPRFAPALWIIASLHGAQYASKPMREAILAAIPIAGGGFAAILFMTRSPLFITNTGALVQQAMWPTAFLSAGFPLLLIAAFAVARNAANARLSIRIVCGGAAGYLAAFALLFLAHQIYYGSLLRGTDHAAALAVSDAALPGAIIGAIFAARKRPTTNFSDDAWYLASLLIFIALAVSAFGGGWFLQFAPQRFMIFIGIILSVVAAEGLYQLRRGAPRVAIACMAVWGVCSLCSFAVSAMVFQGPFGMRPGLASDLGMRTAYLTNEEFRCLNAARAGTMLAPGPINDILSLREGIDVLGGFGAADLSDQPAVLLDAAVDEFYQVSMSAEARARFVKEWCLDYVFVPGAHRELINELESLPNFALIGVEGNARLYEVE
ncbi:MAG: hypothetical protein SGI88_21550 [Candidatus Hydrogenedentes bacterium]|nr:hypothetical protein [Candidatus Hydrogenedentota bacterium]